MVKFNRSKVGKVVEVTDEIMEAITTIKSLKPQIDQLEAQIKEKVDAVKMFMADADSLCMPGSKEHNPSVIATWKSAKDTEKFDAKRFSIEHPELYEEYLVKQPGSRRFLIK